MAAATSRSRSSLLLECECEGTGKCQQRRRADNLEGHPQNRRALATGCGGRPTIQVTSRRTAARGGLHHLAETRRDGNNQTITETRGEVQRVIGDTNKDSLLGCN